ncbi:MAG: MFS transporter [Alphaproteobacteria bacterium]|jgi:MFS family permease|nr:MFS transporter [Alphaproteobacteria bacterium]
MPILSLVAFINMVGFGMIFPLLPLFKIEFLLTDLQVGYIASIFAVFGLFGTLFFGIMCDKYGRKYTLGIASVLSGIVYILTGYAESYLELLIFRGLSGFLTSCFVICFVIVSDISTKENKFRYMGIMGASFSLGIIFGPSIGGMLAGNSNNINEISLNLPFLVSGIISLGAGILALLFIKESLSAEERKLEKKANILNSLKELYSSKTMILFTYLILLFSLMFAGIEVYLSIWLNEGFHFTAQDMGYYWGMFGVVITITQLTLPKILSERQALIGGLLLFGLSCFLLQFATSVYMLIGLGIIMALGMGVFFPSINVNLSLQGNKNEQGLIFGINRSFDALGRIVGPSVLGWIYLIHPSALWISIAAMCAFTSILILIILGSKLKESTN